jgi:phage terminase large subunit
MKLARSYYDFKHSRARVQVHQGGTRSGKTYSILLGLVEFCAKNQNGGRVVTICRKTFPSLRASAMRDFFQILSSENLYDPRNHNKSDGTYNLFGNVVEFISIDQPQRIRGRKRDVLFINEANELALEDWRQLILRTTYRAILDYNPSDEEHWIYDHVLTRDDVEFFQTTYLDNPFLEPEVVTEIERLKDTDPNYWRVFGQGERGINTTAVFTTWTPEEVPQGAKLIAYGLDWGFTNDPTALVAVYKLDHHLYLDQLIYQGGLTNPDIAELIREKITDRTEIIADSAEPKSIEELYRYGFNVKPAHKGPDSIRAGIDVMKRHVLHPTPGSTDLIRELRNYRWQTDKNDKPLNQPIDAHNHALDAVRYVCLNKLARNNHGRYLIR